ncbi:unnamed protein product [Phyllotreta striolata]|uniref:MARVEL domain-containing protein n=1 Tax=Phyllotreta striolata TaxID=444603 RepID=A0A9N9TZK0_PHYSR|nr:unnamed protein product [Phyllotreta striolata]
MSAQKHGVEYLKSYPGLLKITEQVLNLAILISGCATGFCFQTVIILVGCVYALITTAFFLIVNYRCIFRKSSFPWEWIECSNCTAVALILALGASVALSEMTRMFVVTGIIGYITAMVYVLETIDRFKLAVTPRARYVWTTPNVPNV